MGNGKEFGMWNSETGIKEKDNHESTKGRKHEKQIEFFYINFRV